MATLGAGVAPEAYSNPDTWQGLPPPVVVELAFRYAALAILAFSGWYWWMRGRRDPLACCPQRRLAIGADSILLAVFAYFIASVALQWAIDSLVAEPHQVLLRSMIGPAAPLAGALVCLAIVAARFDGGIRRFIVGPVGFGRGVAWSLAPTVVAFGVTEWSLRVTVWVIHRWSPDYSFVEHQVIDSLQQNSGVTSIFVVVWIGAAVVTPLCEEVFFRGLLQTFCASLVRSRWIVIVVVSLVFALGHAQWHTMPALFLLSLVLGFVYERTGSLWPVVVIHALFNLKTLIAVWAQTTPA